jgi:hypothetical protein
MDRIGAKPKVDVFVTIFIIYSRRDLLYDLKNDASIKQ